MHYPNRPLDEIKEKLTSRNQNLNLSQNILYSFPSILQNINRQFRRPLSVTLFQPARHFDNSTRLEFYTKKQEFIAQLFKTDKLDSKLSILQSTKHLLSTLKRLEAKNFMKTVNIRIPFKRTLSLQPSINYNNFFLADYDLNRQWDFLIKYCILHLLQSQKTDALSNQPNSSIQLITNTFLQSSIGNPSIIDSFMTILQNGPMNRAALVTSSASHSFKLNRVQFILLPVHIILNFQQENP